MFDPVSITMAIISFLANVMFTISINSSCRQKDDKENNTK